MAAFAFALPILPGQDGAVERIGEAVSGSGELREEYEASRKALRISEEKVWVQRTPLGQALIVYWETEDPQRTLRALGVLRLPGRNRRAVQDPHHERRTGPGPLRGSTHYQRAALLLASALSFSAKRSGGYRPSGPSS